MRIGLTGGIGSGKTTVCQLFAEYDIPIIDADVIARQLVEPGTDTLSQIVETFGNTVLQASGELDRAALRSITFSNETSRKKLEALLHPAIREAMLTAAETQTAAYCILAIPLLFETGQQSLVDRVLVIDCTEAQQLSRVVVRDQRDREETLSIIRAQCPRQQRLAAADDIIENDGSIEDLAQQVKSLHRHYLQLASSE